jgi:hypothetical protein
MTVFEDEAAAAAAGTTISGRASCRARSARYAIHIATRVSVTYDVPRTVQ